MESQLSDALLFLGSSSSMELAEATSSGELLTHVFPEGLSGHLCDSNTIQLILCCSEMCREEKKANLGRETCLLF